jgi:hypothetical protein
MWLTLQIVLNRAPARSTAYRIHVVLIHLDDILVSFFNLVLQIRDLLGFRLSFHTQVADLQTIAVIKTLRLVARKALTFVDTQSERSPHLS